MNERRSYDQVNILAKPWLFGNRRKVHATNTTYSAGFELAHYHIAWHESWNARNINAAESVHFDYFEYTYCVLLTLIPK